MRGRVVLTGVLAGVLALSTAAPAMALLGGVTDTTGSLVSPLDPLLGGVTEPLLDTADALASVADDVVDELGAGPLSEDVVGALLATDLHEDGSLDDPFGLNWPAYLPAWPDQDYVDTLGHECRPGNVQCVDKVLRDMERRYDRLACHDNAIFSLTYKLTTQEYRRAVEDPHYFDDNAFLNHQDAVFAHVYFDAIDDWSRTRIEDVPPAWRVAFDAADREVVATTGHVLLGMNAHIRRDLPFVLETIGLVTPDGETRKSDHDRVNGFLAEVQSTITEQVQLRHDPDFGTTNLPLGLDEHGVMHAIRLMREEAWRKAELLVAAETPEQRDRVAALIEYDAALSAVAIRTLLHGDADGRVAHCTAWRESS
jgi:hypothetical protein